MIGAAMFACFAYLNQLSRLGLFCISQNCWRRIDPGLFRSFSCAPCPKFLSTQRLLNGPRKLCRRVLNFRRDNLELLSSDKPVSLQFA